jgi:hypothetical protein
VLCQSGEQLTLFRIRRQVAHHFAFRDLDLQLLKVRSDVFHRMSPRRLQAGRRQPLVDASCLFDLVDLLEQFLLGGTGRKGLRLLGNAHLLCDKPFFDERGFERWRCTTLLRDEEAEAQLVSRSPEDANGGAGDDVSTSPVRSRAKS